MVDAEGLGNALWQVLGPPGDTERWRLYTGRGTARPSLVDALLVAVHEGSFHFAPNLPEQEPMTKALQGHRRQVGEDGVVGSELVVALLLALIPPEPPVEPDEFAWSWADSPFSPSEVVVLSSDRDGKPLLYGSSVLLAGEDDWDDAS